MKKLIPVIFLFLLNTFTFQQISAQTFLNGSFETNTAVGDQINLTNAAFNALVSNTISFGSFGDMDVITSGTYCGTAQNGLWFVAFTGGGSDAIAMQLSAPLVPGNTYTISFWDRACCPTWTAQPFQIGLSTTNNAMGSIVYNGPLPTCNVWTNRTLTFVAPNNGQYITVQSGGVYSTSEWTQVDNFSFVISGNTITTGIIAGAPFCACDSVNVPFTSTGAFTPGNVYTAQLSDATGSFAIPVDIGTLTSFANNGSIPCMIPCNTVSGTLYRIRVVSSAPAVIGSDNGINITISAPVSPSVSISASPSGAICAGDLVTFTAIPGNGGTAPVYQWQINGLNAGMNAATFSSSAVNNGDIITVILTSNAPCATPASDTSNTIIMTVNPTVMPTVMITAVPSGSICAGDLVTFTATSTNGGTAPVFQWQVNGINAGTNSATYSSAALNNGDVVTVILTSNATCASPASDTSNSITMSVNTVLVPLVNISASPSVAICAGDSVTFTAIPNNGGAAPFYQWQVNGVNAGTNAAVYSSSALNNGDVVTVIMTSNASCASPASDTSNSIVMSVNAVLVPSVSISASPAGPVCSGTLVYFTATALNGGSVPVYQWQVNGVNAGANAATFSSSALNNGDVITVILTSNAPCALPISDTSNTITMTVNPSVAPTVVITAAPSGPVCAGDLVTFNATTTNGGSAPFYQWQINGVNTGTNAATYSSSALNNGDAVTVILTSNAVCASPATVVSNAIHMIINTLPVITISPDITIISGDSTTLTAYGGATYNWSPSAELSCSDCQTTTASPVATTTYCVQATDNNGCHNSACVIVSVDIQCGAVYIPNIFSPNGDHNNDIFYVHGNCIMSMDFIIYDRWGEKIFASTGIENGWDGTMRGNPLDAGVFYYYLKAVFIDGSIIKRKGNVTLVR